MTLRVGVIGGGLIAQVAHLPALTSEPERFRVHALAEPSGTVRDALARRYGIEVAYESWQRMLDDSEGFDAVVVCSPHATHAEIVLAAIERKLHVFVEKPLCIDPLDAERIIAARDRADVVVQVGYMKRFDPTYEDLLEQLPDSTDRLRFIDVVTYDPWLAREPFIRDTDLVRPADLDMSAIEDLRLEEKRQAETAIGTELSREEARAYAHTYLACLIHDTNVVHGILEAMNEPLPTASLISQAWAGEEAATTVSRLNSGALWATTWLLLRGMNEFREHVRLCFEDAVWELEFPSPYSRTESPRLVNRTGAGKSAERSRRHPVAENYLRELNAFFDAVTGGAPCRTPPEQSLLDITTLRDLFAHSIGDKLAARPL